MNAIFENYELFMREHQNQLNRPQDVNRLMSDDGMFRAYVDSLVEGLDNERSTNVSNVLNRQREMIIQEAANVGASSFASGWTVMTFPILVDIYAEPIISELCNVYPTDKPVLSIPKVSIKATTKSYDGLREETAYIPTPTKMVRAGIEEVNISPATNTNVFTATGLNRDHMKMNRRFTLMKKLSIIEKDNGGTILATHSIPVNFRPDNRNQIARTVTFLDNGGETATIQITGNVDYESGNITFQALPMDGTVGNTYECEYATMNLKFTPVATMAGRTKVTVETEMTDITIDPCEDFLIDLTEEEIQDFSSIFKVDLLRTISEAIKRQMLLNKDFELAYFLNAAESDIAKHGAKLKVDMNAFTRGGGAGDYAPASSMDVFRSVVPYITNLMSIIRRNYNMYPTYLVAGLKTASLLRSLQDFATNFPAVRGEIGLSGGTSQFLKMKVLESVVMPESNIYMSTKAPQNSLEKSSIIDLIYQPMYIVKEITDGNIRHFVRSRTMVEIVRTDGLGMIEVDNLDQFLVQS